MIRLSANLPLAAACAACLFSAGQARGAQADSGSSYPVHVPAAWLPCEGSLGVQAGVQISDLGATGEYRDLVEPVPARERGWISPSWGAVFSVRWRPGFTLAFAPRWETFGLRTVEDTVSFQGNPYPHTLRARAELDYRVLPVLLGMGWYPGRQHFQVQLGAYAAYLDQADVAWTVDGEPYGGHPAAAANASYGGWMVAAEYGHRWGPGDMTLGIEFQRAGESALAGLKGSMRLRAAQIRLGYAWVLWHRSP